MAYTEKYYISGSELLSTDFFDITELEHATALYEVVKIINGKALFFEQHIERLRKSARLSGKSIDWNDDKICSLVEYLIQATGVKYGRLKFLFRYKENETPMFFAFFLNDITPEPKYYKEGVKTVLYRAVRKQPGIKMINYNLRHSVKDYIQKKNAFEVLLVNEEGYITEGSKSNFFAVKNNTLITPPAETVLAGITRDFVQDICRGNNIPLYQEAIPVESCSSFDSAFLSGTSIGILPIYSIEKTKFEVQHPIVKKIAESYAKQVADYIKLKQIHESK